MNNTQFKISLLEEGYTKPPQKKLATNIVFENSNDYSIWVLIPEFLDIAPRANLMTVNALELRKRKGEIPYMKIFGDQVFSIFKVGSGEELELPNWIFLTQNEHRSSKVFFAAEINIHPADVFSDILLSGELVIPPQIPDDAALLKNINASQKAQLEINESYECPFDLQSI